MRGRGQVDGVQPGVVADGELGGTPHRQTASLSSRQPLHSSICARQPRCQGGGQFLALCDGQSRRRALQSITRRGEASAGSPGPDPRLQHPCVLQNQNEDRQTGPMDLRSGPGRPSCRRRRCCPSAASSAPARHRGRGSSHGLPGHSPRRRPGHAPVANVRRSRSHDQRRLQPRLLRLGHARHRPPIPGFVGHRSSGRRCDHRRADELEAMEDKQPCKRSLPPPPRARSLLYTFTIQAASL
jgi:hypothetical protein